MRFEGIHRELLEACRGGNFDAFEELCVAVQRDLYGFIYSVMRNHDDTDEVLQETLLRIHKHLPQLEDLDKFPGWAMRIAVNQCNSHHTHNNAKALYSLDTEIEVQNEDVVGTGRAPESPRDAMARTETKEHINIAISQLPPKQRAAIVMFEVEERSIREIAEILECSEGVVKFNIHEARKKLRKSLGPLLRGETGGAVRT